MSNGVNAVTAVEQFLAGGTDSRRTFQDSIGESSLNKRDATYSHFQADQRALEAGVEYRPLVVWGRAGANISKKKSGSLMR